MRRGIAPITLNCAAAVFVAGAIVVGTVHEALSQQNKRAPPSATQAPNKARVFSGNEARIGRIYNVLADCSSGPRPDVRIVKPPENGTFHAEAAQWPVDERAGSPRANCNGKIVDATVLTYKSNDDFVGEDKVTIDVDYKLGAIRRFTWIIDVR